MNSKNKKKVKMRKAIRYLYMLVAIVLFVASILSLYSNLFKNTINVQSKNIDTYIGKFNCQYIVNLKENNFITEKTQEMDKYYLTDLIDNISMDLSYNYKTQKSQNIKYSYKIIGTIVGVYTKDGEEEKVWEKDYNLLDEKSSQTNGTEVKISENIKLDVPTYNAAVSNFEEELKMNIDTTFKVQLKTKVTANNETVEYVSDVKFDLGERTTRVSGNLSDEKTGFTVQNVEETKKPNIVIIILDVILLIIAVVIYKYITSNTRIAHNVKNTYRIELNRILKLCQDKIVQVKNKPNITEQSIIDVKDFGEIIKVSEELFKPILYWDSKNDEAWFVVMSNSAAYRYILK